MVSRTSECYALLLESALQGSALRLLRCSSEGAQRLADLRCSEGASLRLAHHLDLALTQHQLTLADISRVVVSCGPGSFTGIKVALAFCQGLFCARRHRKPESDLLWWGVSPLAMIFSYLIRCAGHRASGAASAAHHDMDVAVGFLQGWHRHGFVAWKVDAGANLDFPHSIFPFSPEIFIATAAFSVDDCQHPSYDAESFYLAGMHVPESAARLDFLPLTTTHAVDFALDGMEEVALRSDAQWSKWGSTVPPQGRYLKGHYAERSQPDSAAQLTDTNFCS